MQDLPHRYSVTARTFREGAVTLSSPGLADVESAAPAEFDGPGDRWSPETLLVGAVADCFILSFRAIARASSFDWNGLACEGEGVLDRVDGVLRFREIHLHVRLSVPTGTDETRARRLLEKAERSCLISRSLVAPVHLEAEVAAG